MNQAFDRLKYACLFVLLSVTAVNLPVVAQKKLTITAVPTNKESYRAGDTRWEAGYQSRLNDLLYAQGKLIPSSGNNYLDEGKNTWSLLLAELYKNKKNKTATEKLFLKGDSLLRSLYAGSLYKPFSVPGYAMYYFQYKNVLPQSQIQVVRDSLYTNGWSYLMRADRQMDPIYYDTEFNSENFNWMARMGGYLFAHEFKDTTKIPYFDQYIRNWIRALYNVGRVEWNSNNYWGHCFNPTMCLYVHAKDPQIKTMAKAGLDWMLTEAALHYLDGFQGGGDVRAKNNAYKPFAGSVWGYSYLYFVDSAHFPTYPKYFGDKKVHHLKDFVGYAPYSDYRPPKVVIDIAQRNFKLPVEVQSAKPFYHLDNDNYADWKGETERSRRFEFETIYMDNNYLLASLASNRPDGNNHCKQHKAYSEESLWRLMVKGNKEGAMQIFGNTIAFEDMAGRDPNEEIGQFRNVMVRIFKNTKMAWVAIPKNARIKYEKETIFADLGNGVYAAFITYNSTEKQTEIWDRDTKYNIHRWGFTDSLSAIVLEVGTAKEYNSFNKFIAKIKTDTELKLTDTNKLYYKSAAKNTIEIEYQPTVTYTMAMGCEITPAGVTPKVWGNGEYIDYNSWDSYRTSFGFDIINQAWGSGKMTLKSKNHTLNITVNPLNGEVKFDTNK